MNSQTSRKTNEMPDCTKRRLRVQKTSPVWNETKHINWRSRHFSQVIRESRFGRPRIARVISSEELGTMSKNNLRRITLVRGPIWGIHSLTLIISLVPLINISHCMFSMFRCYSSLQRKQNNQQTEVSIHVPFSVQQPIRLTTWEWGCKDFMMSTSVSMSFKSFCEALSRTRIKVLVSKRVGCCRSQRMAKLDKGRANPVSTDLTTNSFSTILKKSKNYPTAALKLFRITLQCADQRKQ